MFLMQRLQATPSILGLILVLPQTEKLCVAALSNKPDTRVIAKIEVESAKPACNLSPQPANQVVAEVYVLLKL